MEIRNLTQFLKTFFRHHHCEVKNLNPDSLTVQLTKQMDKVLMNRPFYWHYMESIGQEGEPMCLTFLTNHSKQHFSHQSIQNSLQHEEWIHFGSPRLQQMMKHLRKTNRFIKIFQEFQTTHHTPLYPWLLINIKIRYEGIHKKEEIFSIGLNLVNGRMETEMMEKLNSYSFSQSISDYCYLISPVITIESGYKRMEKVIDEYISNQDHAWAEHSLRMLDEEILLIEHFYDTEKDKEKLEKEVELLKRRYLPNIIYEIINGGLVYLTKESL